jgi:hypothetical protein
LLFNLCLEPRLQLVKKRHSGRGAFVQVGDERVEFNVQAYADDVVFVSERPGSVQEMLSTLDAYVRWARMEVTIAKCATTLSLIDGNNHRCTLDQEFIFRGQGIPNLTMAQSLKYLGTAISARRKVRLEAAPAKYPEMGIRLQKIVASRLLTIQKTNAIKTFLLPTLHFVLLNGDVGKKQLKKTGAKIRAQVDALLNVHGLPVECHHASWMDGGLGYPSLVNRREVLMVRSFTQMMTSNDEKVRTAMRQLTEDERMYQRIEKGPGESFLNWRHEHGMRGTTSLAARTGKTCQALNIRLKLEAEEMVVRTDMSK